MTTFKATTKLFIVLVVVIFTTAYITSTFAKMGHESNIFYQYTRVPDIELSSGMLFYGNSYGGEVLQAQREGQIAYGEITGFVALSKIENQPIGARQYQTIIATDDYDERGVQIFELYDTFKLSYVSPSRLDEPTIFYVADNNPRELLLTNQNGWSIQIQKQSFNPRITSTDNQGDRSFLLTTDSDFQDFMERLHR